MRRTDIRALFASLKRKPHAPEIEVIHGNCRRVLASLAEERRGSFRCCVTSPPYWKQRAYLL
jgi:DNA modification methylase